MCAISGIFTPHGAPIDHRVLRAMSRSMNRRGPDGHALETWQSCALAHERLAVIDVAGGRQPILNEDGSRGLVANGEIYNYLALRRWLIDKGHRFRTGSDSEVILHGFEECGCEIFEKLDGMFAAALWDNSIGRLILARDWPGKKPLAYTWLSDRTFAFASDVRALRFHPAFDDSLRLNALREYLEFRCVQDPGSIYAAVQKVPAGTWMSVDPDGRIQSGCHAALPEAGQTRLTYAEAKEELRCRLRNAVSKRLMSEVPLGVLLSGGIDSSIVAAEAAVLQKGIHTFTLGFEGQSDERPLARLTSDFLCTSHEEQEIPLEPEQDLVEAEAAFDEPMADSSAVATAKICRLARSGVTVVLNGDGGDESFAGYNHFREFVQSIRVGETEGFTVGARFRWRCSKWMPKSWRRSLRTRLRPHELAFRHADRWNRWHAIRRVFEPDQVTDLLGLADPPAKHSADHFEIAEAEANDYCHYLPSDLLVKMDRASMAFGLEARSPFLDRELIQLTRQLPLDWKIDDRGRSKRILRDAYSDRLPRELWQQPKRGFQSPVKQWLRHSALRDRIRELSEANAAKLWDHLDAGTGRRLLRRFLRGAGNEQQVWSLLILERWLQSNSGKPDLNLFAESH